MLLRFIGIIRFNNLDKAVLHKEGPDAVECELQVVLASIHLVQALRPSEQAELHQHEQRQVCEDKMRALLQNSKHVSWHQGIQVEELLREQPVCVAFKKSS